MLSALFIFIKAKALEAFRWLIEHLKQPQAPETSGPITPVIGIRAEAEMPAIAGAAIVADGCQRRRQRSRKQEYENEAEL